METFPERWTRFAWLALDVVNKSGGSVESVSFGVFQTKDALENSDTSQIVLDGVLQHVHPQVLLSAHRKESEQAPSSAHLLHM